MLDKFSFKIFMSLMMDTYMAEVKPEKGETHLFNLLIRTYVWIYNTEQMFLISRRRSGCPSRSISVVVSKSFTKTAKVK
jgi:hypothetical protein